MDKEITAGRELDALVAEKIMGEAPGPRDVEVVHTIPHMGCVMVPYVPLPYSTDIAAAWSVVEKLGLWCRVYYTPQWADHYSVSFTPEKMEALLGSMTQKDMRASGKTLPLAICLAGLKAASYG